MYDSVQFKGIENVIKAFEQRDVEFWGIWQKKCLITKGMGSEELKTFLQMLIENGSGAVYTLKIFEDIDDLKKIKENSSADGSFSFRLNSDMPGTLDSSMNNYEQVNSRNKLFQRLDAIENKLNGVGEEENEPDTFYDKVIGIISDPNRLQQYVGIIKEIFSNNNPQPAAQSFRPAVAAIGNTQPVIMKAHEQPTADTMERLAKALDTLEKHDPKIVDHLEKLANLASEKPGKFKGLLTMLENFF